MGVPATWGGGVRSHPAPGPPCASPAPRARLPAADDRAAAPAGEMRVGWGHTCGDACLGGSLPPSEPLRPCHPPEAPPNWTWSCSLSGSAPAPCSSCVQGRCSSCRTEPLPTLPSALRPPPPCACPCPLSTGCPSFFVLITPSPDHGLRRGAPHHLRISVALRLRESWSPMVTALPSKAPALLLCLRIGLRDSQPCYYLPARAFCPRLF